MEIIDCLKSCRSVRSFDSRPVPEDVVLPVLEQLRLAPSASNHQPWRFLVIRDPGTRRQLASAARSQFFIAEAPVLIVACGYPERAQDFMGGLGNSLRIDIAIAFDRMMLAAVAQGLATCWIGAYDEKEVQNILGIPESVRVVGMTPLGYPADPSAITPAAQVDRNPFEDIIHYDRYPDENQ